MINGYCHVSKRRPLRDRGQGINVPVGMPLHIVQRGNNRNICFVCDEDYQKYLSLLTEGAAAYRVDVHAWVLMTNHIHLLVTPTVEGGVSNMMRFVNGYYVQYFNKHYQRSGTLWEGRFKSCLVDAEAYFLICQRYIELNPVRAQMVEDPGQYRWSSYQTNAFGIVSNLITPHFVYLGLSVKPEERMLRYRQLLSDALEKEIVEDLRGATASCLAFGSDYFKDQVETLYGRRVRAELPGPKPEH